jgi:cytochrome c-type biogenesis protein CcmF
MAQIGYFALVLALISAAYTLLASIVSIKKQRKQWLCSAAHALQAIAGLFTLAVFVLLYLLLRRDFQIAYVASYTNISLAPIYVLSALWAGQEGSLLFWGWMLSLCSAIFIWKVTSPPIPLSDWRGGMRGSGECKDKSTSELSYIYLVFALVLGFFLTLQIFAENPFRQLQLLPFDGNGLNPLLQNPYMVLHPPILFLGYAGFIVPFALTMAVLCTGVMGDDWVQRVRRWTLFSWYCLGIGILLGAHWAYLELGWGGYWAWDPVENASFIPWIISTALLHTLILQRRKGLLPRWNLVLCILTFALCIFGAFITRSGMLASVHAFGQSPIGYCFLAFLSITFLSAAGLLAYRWKTLRTSGEVPHLISKESSFFLANQLLIGLGFAVLYGTVYPLCTELITGEKIMLGTSFFNTIGVLIGLVLLGLIGICQRIGWGKISPAALGKRFRIPLAITMVGTILLFAFGMKDVLAILTCSLGLFVFVVTVLAVFRRTGKRRYAAYIFHLGVVVICIGIAVSSTYRLEQEVELKPGASVTLGHFRFQYDRLREVQDTQKTSMAAEISLYKEERKIAVVTPAQRFYGQSPDNTQATTEIGLYSSWQEDVYVILSSWQDDQTATLRLRIHPFIAWIWIGGFGVFTIGILVTMIPESWGKKRGVMNNHRLHR